MEGKIKKGKSLHNSIFGVLMLGILTVGVTTFMSMNPDELGQAEAAVINLHGDAILVVEIEERDVDLTHDNSDDDGSSDYEHLIGGNHGVIHAVDDRLEKQAYMNRHREIDLIWLHDGTITGVNYGGLQNESCHVLEVEKGFFEKHNLKIGERLDFNINLLHDA